MFKINLIIKLNSITYAVKARELIKKRNYKAIIRKNPNPKKGEGCGYEITVPGADESLVTYLEMNRIPVIEAVRK